VVLAMTEETLFAAALEKRTPAERAAFLDEACAGDGALRQQVESLLNAHAADDQFLAVPAPAQVAAAGRPAKEATVALDASLPGALTGVRSPHNEHLVATRGDPSQGNAGDQTLAILAPSPNPGSLGRLDHFEVHEVVGHGGMGVVLKAFDEKLHRIVAIKVLAPQMAASGTARQRFAREARAAAAVVHEHVIDIHEVEEAGPVPYLVMHYVAGISLEERIRQGGPLELKEILRIGIQTAAGLAAAHAQGLVHRDIKPGNILLENGVQRVKITDFGLARAVDDASLTQSGVITGTPLFMSPEQARGDVVDCRSDLFSLGSVLYTLCTGRPPFRASSSLAVLKRVSEDTPRPIREINPDIPDWLAAIIAKLHAKDPAGRFQTAAEVAELLGQHLAHLQQPQLVPLPPPVLAGVPAPRWPRRAVIAVAVGTAAVILAAAPWLIAPFWGADAPPDPGTDPGQARPFVPPGPPTEEELAKLPSPLDSRKRDDIPSALLALAGGGDPALAPPQIVALLGTERFRLPQIAPVGRMAVSPDGSLLAVACGNGVTLFDAATGGNRKILTGLRGRVMPVAFSPDSKFLAASCIRAEGPVQDYRVMVWDVTSGQETAAFTGHTGPVWALLFNRDGKVLYSAGEDRLVKVWDLASKTALAPLGHAQGGVGVLALSPDGKLLAGAANSIVVWDTQTGEERTNFVPDKEGRSIHGLAFSRPDGKFLAAGNDSATQVWKTATWEKVHILPGPAEWLDFSPDGESLFTAPRDSQIDMTFRVNVRKFATGDETATYLLNSQGGYPEYCLSPDGKTIYAMRCNPSEGIVHCYDATTGQERFQNQGHRGRVHSLAVSPDGKLLASGGDDRIVRLWDLAHWKVGDPLAPAQTLDHHSDRVLTVTFSLDGKFLASRSLDGTVVLHDLAGGKNRTWPGHPPDPWWAPLSFSPDCQTLAAAEYDGSVKLMDVASGQEKTIEQHLEKAIRGMAYSPNGDLLAVGGHHDHSVEIWDLKGRERGRYFGPNTTPITGVAFSPDGRTLAWVSDAADAALRLADLDTGKVLFLKGHTSHIGPVVFHPAGRLVATGAVDNTVRIWDRRSAGRNVLTVDFGVPVRAAAFTPEGRYLVVGTETGMISILKVPVPPVVSDLGSVNKPIDPLKLASRPSPADALRREDIPEHRLKKAGGGDKGKAPAELVAVLAGDQRALPKVVGVAISPDGKTLAACAIDGTVKLWDLGSGQCRRTLSAHQGACRDVAFSPDGKLLASVGDDRQVKLWDLAGEGARSMAYVHPDWLDHVAFSPDGKTVASAGGGGSVKVGDVATGRLLRTLTGHTGLVCALAFSPDGNVLASAGGWRPIDAGAELKLWDLRSGWESSLEGHTAPVRAVAFSPDGRKLATSSDDGTIRLWDLTSGGHETLLGHDAAGKALVWRPDGQVLASTGGEGKLRLWGVSSPGTPCQVLRLFPQGSWLDSVAFTPEGRYLATANPDGTVYVLRLAAPGKVFQVPAQPR
jgi:WD40 repeat protein/tRNA A-37 threonylcarbamoyl transferase component Bud32